MSRIIGFKCDNCGARSKSPPIAETFLNAFAALRLEVRKQGWRVFSGRDYCPKEQCAGSLPPEEPMVESQGPTLGAAASLSIYARALTP